MTKMAIEEQHLIAECKKGKDYARKKIYDLYAPVMFGVCIRYVRNTESAKDILQEGFIKLFTKIEMYSGEGSFAGWVRRIFVTTALEFLRRQNELRYSLNIDEYAETFENTDYSIIDKISADDLMAYIAQLPSGYRTVFNLYVIEGYSHAEIAEELHITESTSRSQYARARKILQENIQSLYSEWKTK